MKMSADEAIRRIKKHNEVHFRKEYPHAIYITEALNMAVKALEKQIPKTVTHEATLAKCYTCPNCNNVVDKFDKYGVRITYEYCIYCGQRLDWDNNL